MADVVDSIVHSFALVEMPHALDLRDVLAETISIPCLVNTVSLEAGVDIVYTSHASMPPRTLL